MGHFCIIGLGSFGFNVARTLFERGHDVVAVDMDQERVQRAHDHASFAIHANAADKEFLAKLGVAEMNAVVVSTGDQSHLATLITLYLRELKVRRIVAKAMNEDHGRILSKVGASDIVYPEKDMAIKTARELDQPNILEFIPLEKGYSITEMATPKRFLGKNLAQLNLRRELGIQVIALKDVLTDQFTAPPDPDRILRDSDVLVMIGLNEAIEKLQR